MTSRILVNGQQLSGTNSSAERASSVAGNHLAGTVCTTSSHSASNLTQIGEPFGNKGYKNTRIHESEPIPPSSPSLLNLSTSSLSAAGQRTADELLQLLGATETLVRGCLCTFVPEDRSLNVD